MGNVIIDISMSLDGFVTGPNDDVGNGMGDGGMALMDWVFKGTAEDAPFLEDPDNALGACVLGRRTLDIAEGAWGDDPPFASADVFVLTHRPHETMKRGTATFHFVTDGLDSALDQAKAAANGRGVALMGASVSRQYLKAGLVDEMVLHIGNILLGAGKPLFADMGDQPIRLERIQLVATPTTTHVRYRVVKYEG